MEEHYNKDLDGKPDNMPTEEWYWLTGKPAKKHKDEEPIER